MDHLEDSFAIPTAIQPILTRIARIPIYSTLEMRVGEVGPGRFEVTIPRR